MRRLIVIYFGLTSKPYPQLHLLIEVSFEWKALGLGNTFHMGAIEVAVEKGKLYNPDNLKDLHRWCKSGRHQKPEAEDGRKLGL
jgi:hypothetical protein